MVTSGSWERPLTDDRRADLANHVRLSAMFRCVEAARTVPTDIGNLIIAKLLVGGSKQLTGAAALCRAHRPELDADRLRQTLRMLEETIGRTDLVTSFDALEQ